MAKGDAKGDEDEDEDTGWSPGTIIIIVVVFFIILLILLLVFFFWGNRSNNVVNGSVVVGPPGPAGPPGPPGEPGEGFFGGIRRDFPITVPQQGTGTFDINLQLDPYSSYTYMATLNLPNNNIGGQSIKIPANSSGSYAPVRFDTYEINGVLRVNFYSATSYAGTQGTLAVLAVPSGVEIQPINQGFQQANFQQPIFPERIYQRPARSYRSAYNRRR